MILMALVLRQLGLLIIVRRLESGVLGPIDISMMIQLEDGAPGLILISRMTDLLFFVLCSVITP